MLTPGMRIMKSLGLSSLLVFSCLSASAQAPGVGEPPQNIGPNGQPFPQEMNPNAPMQPPGGVYQAPASPNGPNFGGGPFGADQPPANSGSQEITPQYSEVTIYKEVKPMYAVLETSKGMIKIRLYPQYAPVAVKNFVGLAKGDKEFSDPKNGRKVTRPFYNGLIFHKVIKDFVIQTGCPLGTGKGGPGYQFPNEITKTLRHNKAGMVSMANVGADSNGSQFFITLDKRPDLDDKHTIFGEVVSGLDVVKAIGAVRVGPTDRPLQRIYLKKVEIIEASEK